MTEILPATAEDAEVMHALLQALAHSLGQQGQYRGSAAALREHGFGPAPAFAAQIAWQAGRAVGLVITLREFSTWRGQTGVFLQDIYVDESQRGTGLGRRLVAAAVDWGRGFGATYLKLNVYTGNSDGIAFYRRLGFTTVEDDRVMVLEGEAHRRIQGAPASSPPGGARS
jgi:GNAT superfamily N-acetyltransferase